MIKSIALLLSAIPLPERLTPEHDWFSDCICFLKDYQANVCSRNILCIFALNFEDYQACIFDGYTFLGSYNGASLQTDTDFYEGTRNYAILIKRAFLRKCNFLQDAFMKIPNNKAGVQRHEKMLFGDVLRSKRLLISDIFNIEPVMNLSNN